MTHPDDEISICAWIRRLTGQGSEVFLSWTHSTEVRTREAKNAASVLGVPWERCSIHGGHDGHVCDQLIELLPSYRLMIRRVHPDRVVCGAFEQGHLDHDATNFLVNQSFPGPVFEVPFYHTYLSRAPVLNRFAQSHGEEYLRLTKEERQFKVELAKSYPSQAIWRNLVLNEARRLATRPWTRRIQSLERMRLQTHKDFLAPHLPQPLADRVRRSAKWRKWVAAVRSFGAQEAVKV